METAMPGPTPSPYGGAPMGRAPRKSNGGLMAAIIAGVFVITLIGGIVVLFLYAAATSGSSLLRALELSVADLDVQPEPVQQPHAVSQSPADLQPQAFLQLVQFLDELGVR